MFRHVEVRDLPLYQFDIQIENKAKLEEAGKDLPLNYPFFNMKQI